MTDDFPLIAQVSNVSNLATLDQMEKLFGFMGKIKDIRMYPSINVVQPQFKVCYIKYAESWSVRVAIHLTNTVFIDRALVVVAIPGDTIPSEDNTSFDLLNPASALPGLLGSGFKDVSNDIAAVDGNLVITSTDTNLDILGLPQYPPLSADQDPNTIEEIRRTVYIENINTQVAASQLLDFINGVVGEVKYLRMAGLDKSLNQSALVEFTDRASIVKALQCDGITLKGNKLKIQHSSSAIVKPQKDADVISEKDTEEAMKRLKEAESLIARVVEPEISGKSSRSRRRSSSRSRRRSSSRSRRRSRSSSRRSSHKRDKRSRSKERRRRSTSRRRKSRSISKIRHTRSRSRPRRSRSRSKGRRPKRSERSYSRSRRSRSKGSDSKAKLKKSRHSRSRSPNSRRRSRSQSNISRSKGSRRSRSKSGKRGERSRSRSRLSRSRLEHSKHSKRSTSKGSSPKKDSSPTQSKANNTDGSKAASRSRSREPSKTSSDIKTESKGSEIPFINDESNPPQTENSPADKSLSINEQSLDNVDENSVDVSKLTQIDNNESNSGIPGEKFPSESNQDPEAKSTDIPGEKAADKAKSRSRSVSKSRLHAKDEKSPRKHRSRSREKKGRSPTRNIRRRRSYSSSESSLSPDGRKGRDKKSLSRHRSHSPRSSKRSSKRSISPSMRRSKRSTTPVKRSKRSITPRKRSRRSISRSPSKYRSHGDKKSRSRKRTVSRSPRRPTDKDGSDGESGRGSSIKKESNIRVRKGSESDARGSDSDV